MSSNLKIFLLKRDFFFNSSDEIDLSKIDKFVLVDHHVSTFNSKAILVIDHRPYDEGSNLPSTAKVIIEQVGSCSSLILKYITQTTDVSSSEYNEILQLLYGKIIQFQKNYCVKYFITKIHF